jgi:WD40 repeat protein
MRPITLSAVFLGLLCSAAIAGKPSSGGGGGSPPPNPDIAYESLSGNSDKLIVGASNGTNASTLYSGPSAFRFDLAPRSQHQIALVDSTTSATVRLLTYSQTGTGAFATTSNVSLTPARRGSNVDFSPDGTKLAYACNSNGIDSEQLCVYDLTTHAVTIWGSDSFYWDLAWFRGGASIAYSTEDNDGMSRLHEIAGPGQSPQVIFTSKGDIDVDASRTNPNALVLAYHDEAGNARIGLWQDGSFIDPDLAHSTVGFFGELSCNDTHLVYLGPPNTSPDWYIRDLTTGLSTTFSKQNLRWVQYWPTCS